MTDDELVNATKDGKLVVASDDMETWYEVDGKIIDPEQVFHLQHGNRIGLNFGETVFHAI
jgi:hypothetical protein